MIISHRHRFIFFAVPKTATHTVREALRPHLGADDWEQQQLFAQQAIPIPEIARIGHGHISARRIRPRLDDDVWRSYFKFGFVRNPFDRFVSICFFLHRENPQFGENPLLYMKQALKNRRFRQRVLVRPQALQLTDAEGAVVLDYIGRFETLQSSYDEICQRLELPTMSLGHANPSEHSDCANYYDDELQQAVADFYNVDLNTFGYEFPGS